MFCHQLAVAVLVVRQDGKILLVKGYNRGWEFPGGYIDYNESIHNAAIREVKEESGLDIQLIKTLGFEHDIKRAKMVVVLSAVPIKGNLMVSEESKNVGFFTYDEALKKINLKNFQKRLERCFNEKNIPYFIEFE